MSRRVYVAGVAFVAVLVALGVVAAWPIYLTGRFVLTAVAAAAFGGAVAFLSRWRKWPWWASSGSLLAGWLVLGIGLAVPGRWASGTMLPAGLVDVLSGGVTGWKDLATVPLPVGDYRNLLIPAILVFLIGTFGALGLSWRAASEGWAVPVALAIPAFGLIFGRTSTSSPLVVGGFRLEAPVEIATGAAALLAGVLWLAWRARERRRVALQRARDNTGVGQSTARRGAAARRVLLAVSMVGIAAVAGAIVTPLVAQTRVRQVLHTAIGPDLSRTDALSPLTTYRNNFSDANYDKTLFSVSSTGELPDRIRLATLTDYDGQTYRVAHSRDDAFLRVPSVLEAEPGRTSSVRIDIDDLRGAWLPIFGSLQSIEFAGGSAPQLADRFYYNADSGTAVESGGVSAGDSYTVTASIPKQEQLTSAQSPGAKPQIAAPPQLAKWLEGQRATQDGAGLADVIETLRSRGYLSHALERPDDQSTPKWMAGLSDYSFRSSAAGHSLARVDTLFTQLLDRESQVAGRAGAGGEEPVLVAAVGDDEQFAVAGAIIAQQLGFPSRVVVGVRTKAENGLPGCADGACRAGDVSAWIEVRAKSGAWIAVDTTPQSTQRVQTENLRERDPQNMTEVQPETAEEVAPPEPQSIDNTQTKRRDDPAADLSGVWEVVRITGISLLVVILVLSPFIVILVAKLVRRRGRRDESDGARAIAGGWDEYVDAAIDTGRPLPGVETRQELATLYATPAAAHLAGWADRASFGGMPVSPAESDQFWTIVQNERRTLRSDLGFWRRLRAIFSVRSFGRQLTRRKRGRSKKAGRGDG